MNNRIFAGTLIFSLVVLFLGTALGQEENSSTDSQIAISNANFVAPSPEKENLNEEWVEISNNGTSDENLTGWTLWMRRTTHIPSRISVSKQGPKP